MSEIKRYSLEVNTGWDDEVVTKTFVLASEHEKALTEAKKEAVREWCEKYNKHQKCEGCPLIDNSICSNYDHCAINYAATIIKKVEGI